MRALLVLGLASGCDAVFSTAAPDAARLEATIEADTSIDAPTTCYGSKVRVCVAAFALPTVVFQAGNHLVDTDQTARCIPDVDGTLCVVFANSIHVELGATIRAIGSRPLALLATEDVLVEGNLDVSAIRNAPTPAGSRGDCAGSTAPGSQNFTSGGGAGGSLGSFGGAGGRGTDANSSGGLPPTSLPVRDLLRGGCHGQAGGGNKGGLGGIGGGAIVLVGETLTIHGLINASGSGGAGAGEGQDGGGGGGAGGTIVLDAAVELVVGGEVFANGGGGGEGSNAETAGNDGETPTTALLGGLGGRNGPGAGGDGGAGGSRSADAASGAEAGGNGGGGGGGGGGVGLIVVGPTVPTSGTISPAPSL